MMRPLDIPLVFDPRNELGLKRDLERLAASLQTLAQDVPRNFVPVPEVGPVATRAGTIAASYDVVTRVRPATGETVTIHLPPPEARDGGRLVVIDVLGSAGTVLVQPLRGALINGAPSLSLASVGEYPVRFDGENFSTPPTVAAAAEVDLSAIETAIEELETSRYAFDAESLTIASGVITLPASTAPTIWYIVVDTEAAAATDDLDTISGGAEGDLLFIRTAASTRDVTLTEAGNLDVSGTSETLANVGAHMPFIKVGSTWFKFAEDRTL